ncbi:hypothetical protein [Luteimicrobium sp. DT211]|uniref:hypothetical protein n=1 Tax=Luteimicrobium sp. DT211 TaxID=3393412 RepID=UPI003CEE9F00
MREDMTLWRTTVKDVLALLNQLDPYGLEPGLPDGAPEDEYEIEAAPIAQRLIKDGAITVERVDAIWLEWFDEPLHQAVGLEAGQQFVASLNGLAQQGARPGATS